MYPETMLAMARIAELNLERSPVMLRRRQQAQQRAEAQQRAKAQQRATAPRWRGHPAVGRLVRAGWTVVVGRLGRRPAAAG